MTDLIVANIEAKCSGLKETNPPETQFEYGIQEYAKSSALPKSKDNRKNIFL